LFDVKVKLRTEATSNCRRDDADFVFRYANQRGQQSADEMWNLCRSPKCQRLFAGMVGGDTAARLDRHWSKTLMDHALLNDFVGLLKCGLDIAVGQFPGKGDVRAQFRVREGRVLFR